MSVPLLATKTLADSLKIDNVRPKLLTSKQAIVNLGEEYLPSKFFSCPRLVRTSQFFSVQKLVVLARSNDKKVNCFRKNYLLQSSERERPTLKKTKERWTSISAWIAAFDSDWIGYVYAGLDHQHLQLSSFSCKSLSTFEFGRALIYFKPWKAF